MVGTRGLEGSFLLMNGDRRIPVKSTQKKCGQTFTTLLFVCRFYSNYEYNPSVGSRDEDPTFFVDSGLYSVQDENYFTNSCHR